MVDPIDLREFGRLEATVAAQGRDLEEMNKKIDHLLELANRSRGGFWVGMSMISMLSSAAGWISHNLLNR